MRMDISGKTSIRASESMADAAAAFAAKPMFLDRRREKTLKTAIGLNCNDPCSIPYPRFDQVQKVAQGQVLLPPASRPGMADEHIDILYLGKAR